MEVLYRQAGLVLQHSMAVLYPLLYPRVGAGPKEEDVCEGAEPCYASPDKGHVPQPSSTEASFWLLAQQTSSVAVSWCD